MPWELTAQPVERPAGTDSGVTGLTLFWRETVRDSCTQLLSVRGQTRDDEPTKFLDTLKKWHQENAEQLQQQSVAVVVRSRINRADVKAIREAFNQIGWIDRFSIETDGAEKSEEAIAFEREAQAVVIRNKLFKQLAIDIQDGRNLWDVFIEQILKRYRESKTGEIAGLVGGGEDYKKLIESTGREGIAAYIRYLLRYSESEQVDSEFGLILDYFFVPRERDAFSERVLQGNQWRPVEILELMHEEQKEKPGQKLSRSRVSFSAGASSEQVDFYNMSDARHQAAFKDFLKDNRTLPQVFIRLVNIPPDFLSWLKTEGITTEIEMIDPLQRERLNAESTREEADLRALKILARQEKAIRDIIFWNRKEKNKAILRELIAHPAGVAEALPVEAAVEQASVSLSTDLSASSRFTPTKPRAMHIVYQQASTQHQQTTQSQAIRQRLAEMAAEEEQTHAPTLDEEPKGELFSKDSKNYAQLRKDPRNPNSPKLSKEDYKALWAGRDIDGEYYQYESPWGYIDLITKSAIEQLIIYRNHFRSFPPLENLPQGFYVAREVLCYDPTRGPRADANSLTLRLHNRLERIPPKELPELNARYLNLKPEDLQPRFLSARTIDAQLTLFLDLMALEDPGITEAIKQDEARKSLLKEILSLHPPISDEDVPLMKEWAWLLHAGCEGVKVLLDKLQAIRDEALRTHVIKTYIDTSGNLAEFLTARGLLALDRLASLTEPQRIWWMALTKKRSIGHTLLENAMDAFLYFCEQYKTLSGRVDLPLVCRYNGVGNISVDLDRLLFILKKSKRCYREMQQFELLEEGYAPNIHGSWSDYPDSRFGSCYAFVPGITFPQGYDHDHKFEFCLMSEDIMPEKGKIYLRTKDGYVAYTMIIPTGEIVRDVVTPMFWGPHPFTLNSVHSVLGREVEVTYSRSLGDKREIIEIISQNGHIYSYGFEASVRKEWEYVTSRRYAEYYTWYRDQIFEPILRSKQSEVLRLKKLHFLCAAMRGEAFVQAREDGVPMTAAIREFIESRYSEDPATQRYLTETQKKVRDPDDRNDWLSKSARDRDEWVFEQVSKTLDSCDIVPRLKDVIVLALEDVIVLAKWYQYLPIREGYKRYRHIREMAYFNGEVKEDDPIVQLVEQEPDPYYFRRNVEEELHLSFQPGEFFRRAHENRQKRIALGLQDELSDELSYYHNSEKDGVTFLMQDLIKRDPQDSCLAMRHFFRRLMQCEDDRSKFRVYYQFVAAQYILTGSPAINDRHRIELLARSLFIDDRTKEWAKAKLRNQFYYHSGYAKVPLPPQPNEVANLSRLTDEQAAILLKALRKVTGDSGTIHLMVEFNDFVGSYFTVPRTQEEVEAVLQQQFLFKMETPHPVVIPAGPLSVALRFSAQVLIVLKDEAIKKDLEAILGEAKVTDLIRQLQSADGGNVLTILLQWILDIKQSQIPYAFERFQEMALGRQMTAAFIGPYREEIKRKANQLSGARSVFPELGPWLCDFIAGGGAIQLETLTLDLLQSYEVRRKKAEKLMSLLSRMSIAADQKAMATLMSSNRTLWFVATNAENRPDLMTVFERFAEVFQGEEVKRQYELSGLLEKLLEHLPEAEGADAAKTREFDRRIRSAQAITPAIFRFAEVEGLCGLIVAEGRLQVSDIEHLQEVKGKTPQLFELFFTLYKTGKIDLAQQAFQIIGALNPTQAIEAELTRIFSPLLRGLNETGSALDEASRELLVFLSTTQPPLDLNLLKIVLGSYLTAPKDPRSELKSPTPEELVRSIRKHLGSPDGRIAALASLYETRPMPSASRLQKAFEDEDKGLRFELAAFRVEMERDPEGKRAVQFRAYDRRENLKRAQAVLREIQELQSEREALPSHRQYQLELDLRYIYAIQNDIPREHPIQAMSREEICSALRENRRILANRAISPRARHLAQLKVLALACEVHYRTTGNFPYSTQILSVLMMLNEPRDLILQINTGEGKTLTSALMATLLWASQEPHAVDICTANMDLAETGFNAYRDFFQYVGVEATLVRASSTKNTYRQDGINFSTVSELSLYRSRGKVLDEESPPESASILLDEVDQSLLDEKTEYRFAMSSDVSQGRVSESVYRWIYPFINAFLESDAYQANKNPIENVLNLKRFMQSELEQGQVEKSSELLAQLKHFERDRLEEWDKQLGQWIASGLGAKMLELNKHYMIELKEEKDGHFVLEAHILIGGQPNQESKWSHGVHQLLHADLNKKLKEGKDLVFMTCVREAFTKARRKEPKDLMQAAFPIEPELSCVDEQTSNSFLMPYKKHIGPEGTRDYRCGRIVGVTGTMGSEREREELKTEGFALYGIPPHKGSNRDDRPLQIKKDEEAQYAAILDLLEEKEPQSVEKREPQPVLIFCRSIEESKKIAEWLASERVKENLKRYSVQRADALSIPSSDELIKRAAQPGKITVSTFFGRGTDIKPNHPEGLCVIITHLLGDRQLRQVQGRAGRQSQKGKTIEIINRTDYPALKGATRRTEEERVAEIRHQTEPGDEKQRQYKIRQVDVIINLYVGQMDEFSKMILSTWERRRREERGPREETAPDEEGLKRLFNRIRAELLDELKPLWDRILETASDLAKKSQEREGKELSDSEDAYSLLTEDELTRCVSDFREQAHRVWVTTAARLEEQLPREQDEETQSRVVGFRNFRPDISDTISLLSRSSSPSPAETPPPSTPISFVSSSSADSTSSRGAPSPAAVADEQACQLSHLSLFALESSSTVVLHQLGEESPFRSWEESVIRQDALQEQFENILSQATSEENLAIYTRLLESCRQRDDFVGRLSQLITNALGDVRAHPEHLEIAARDYYRGVVRLLQGQLRLKQDAKMMPQFFELLLLPLMQMADGAKNIVLKQQVREAFLTHAFNMAETRGTDQYAQSLLMQMGDSVKFIGQDANQMRNLMVQLLRQYGASKMAADRRVLLKRLIPSLEQAQNREKIRSVLDDTLIGLLQDDRKHHRDYSKPGRCYQLLVQCKQVLETHDMPEQMRVNSLKTDHLRYSMITLLQQYGAHKIAADRRALVDGLIDKLVRAESTTEAMDRILKEGLKKLLKDDQIHNRNHNKVGRCSELLIHCNQLLETHDKTGKKGVESTVSVVSFFETERKKYVGNPSSKYQPVSTARPFFGVVG